MTSCDHCRGLLLDHLYGLLDAADAVAVEKHLAGCPGCTAEAARARGLFARAAKSSFPHVRFTPPVEVEANGQNVTHTVPSTVARSSRPARRGSWVQWAVAAGILAMIPGTLLPLAGRSARYEAARRDAETAAGKLAEARTAYLQAEATDASRLAERRYAAAKQKHDAVLAEWTAAEKAADQQAKAAPLAVEVRKPIAVQPGAPNEFAVTLRDRAGSLAGRRVEAQVRDQGGAVLVSQVLNPKVGDEQPVRLPAAAWSKLTANSELFLAVAAVDEATGTRTDVLEPTRLFGPVFATMLVTDKSSYRPGERVYFRSLTLDRVTFRPPAREQRLHYTLSKPDGSPVPGAALTGTTGLVRVTEDRVEPVAGPDGKPVRGVGCGAFALPPELPDGDYLLTLAELTDAAGTLPAVADPVTRTIRVRAGKPERFAKTISFTAASFAPGSQVAARAEAKFQDKPLVGAAVTAVVTVDDKPGPLVAAQTTGPDGRAVLKFNVPKLLDRGDVKLMVTFRTPDAEESVAERVPVAGREQIIEFFPEGGKLVAGVPNRVYVRGTTPAGRPVDVRGTVVDGTDTVAKVEVVSDSAEPGANRGLGSFTITPKAGTAYRLKLETVPQGADAAGFVLPRAEADGVALTVADAVTTPGQPVRVRLYSAGRARKLVVGAYTRGRLVDTQRVAAEPGTAAEVKLLAGTDPRGGVTRITAFEEPADPKADLIPVAERLVFRRPGEILNLAVNAGVTGSGAELSIAATDEKGTPVPAILWAAVVNTAVAPGAKDRSLPTHFLLAGEVQTPDDLEHADFLLTDHPKAAVALDHVLATQGWRRFVEQAGPAGVARMQPGARAADASRLLVMNGQRPLTIDPVLTREYRRVGDAYWPKFTASAKELAVASRAKTDVLAASFTTVRERFAEYEARRHEAAGLTAAAQAAVGPLAGFRSWALAGAGVGALLAAGLGAAALTRGGGVVNASPLLIAAVGSGGLAASLAWGATVTPVSDPTLSGDELRAPQQPAAADALNPKLVPSESAAPGIGDVIVQGPNRSKAGEPFALSGIQQPGTGGIVRKTPEIGAPGIKRLIPDDLLDRKPTSKARPPVPTGVFAREQADDRRAADAAAAFATRRAAALDLPDDPTFAGLRTPPFVIREYAAPRPGSGHPTVADADTVLWQPVIVLPADGRVKLPFHLGTAPGGYQVLVAGHTPDGRLGSVRTVLPVAPAPPK